MGPVSGERNQLIENIENISPKFIFERKSYFINIIKFLYSNSDCLSCPDFPDTSLIPDSLSPFTALIYTHQPVLVASCLKRFC
ncbi:hypothetical protein BGP_5281 [Beggiatoa sp. PS]|nr:hypothetical protein BGP_5281 [Beggiatoa sp. PS]